jgi:hypothetical protein
METSYYYIKISKFLLILWLILGTLFSIPTMFISLIIPLYYYFILKNCKYYYDNEKLIVETGVFNKKQKIVPLYRIVNITARENIFNFGEMYIRDKEQAVVLKYVYHSKEEMIKLTKSWDNAKKLNIRNEII